MLPTSNANRKPNKNIACPVGLWDLVPIQTEEPDG